METQRIILHIDLDAFFCSVEERYDSSLAGTAFAVGGSSDRRGVISTCSYAARQYGVRSAMPTAKAFQLCPHLNLLPIRHGTYGNVSNRVMKLVRELSPLVEQISIDEAFVDLTAIAADWKDAERIGRILQYRIKKELELPSSVGIASSKLLAKIATEEGKAMAKKRGDWLKPPYGFTVVLPGTESAFLAPLPIDALWGVGPKMAAKLRGLGIETLGQLAEYSLTDLVRLYGKWGLDLSQRAKGLDHRAVTPFRDPKSVSKETTFARDVSDRTHLVETLSTLAAGVCERLHAKGYSGRTAKLKIRWPDFSLITRQAPLPTGRISESLLLERAIHLLDTTLKPHQTVRLIGIGVGDLRDMDGQSLGDDGQLSLFLSDE